MTIPTPPVVLIVDDDEPIAQYVADVVAQAGYHPVIAMNGQEAIGLVRAHSPALVITDLMMPYLSVAELIAALRAEAVKNGARIPVILITAVGLPVARAAGADAILRKPFRLEYLLALLHRFLAAGSSERTSRAAKDE